MIVILDRKTLEAALVKMPFARCVVMSMISHRVGQGDPKHEIAQSPIFGRLENKMPMIRYQLI